MKADSALAEIMLGLGLSLALSPAITVFDVAKVLSFDNRKAIC